MARRMVSGEELLHCLLAAGGQVKVLAFAGEVVGTFPVDVAFCIARSAEFQGRVHSDGRVSFIRALRPPTPQPEADSTHWDGRACIRFHPDQTTVPSYIQDKRVADIWARILMAPPAYMVHKPATVIP